ncbi:MAG: thioredoxin family protein [Nitrososphaeraceae archaeon]|nr:thioredoxin family protein [Nitrososphaeraceae archaeon]
MKKIFLIALLGYFVHNANSQTSWVNDLKVAKALALQNDQLILIDFAASWCGPCKAMDKKMWNTPELAELSKKFVALKIDIDYNRSLASQFDITSIPRVIVITANEDIVWDEMGFRSSSPYIKMMEQMPKSLNGINKLLLTMDENDPEMNYKAGQAYQNLAKNSEEEFSGIFFNLSDKYFKTARKKAANDELIYLAELNELLNDAYQGKHDKTLKKVEKLDLPGENEKLSDMEAFVLAYCYKCEENEKAFLKAKEKIKSKELIEQLD